ncbi:1-acyl-sn-glycerol-3-phosphate acyltransferase [Corallococcus sp. bb12-1]|uniref:1-acyl-sn-glycerol-3-phosphate acyltransferase n=1 Tax=Corallococcus sp. bb12-1 TaxID=2996784 RepID=UPI00226FF30C|nr:1-acyl-sn-glycerol-3-phosphate acyltransferase [Corallococcus sp. bb12-1]MCY1047491.1 1-acyl-sn-glycerol-3-phosphate acyltransferase [Corallococcus sp. bb12-1]
MTKGVLGNDPFQRGAAPRADDAREDKAAKKAPASKNAKGAKDSAGKSAKSGGKARGAKASAKPAQSPKPPKAGKGRGTDTKPAVTAPKTPAVAVHKFEARANARGATSGSPQEHEERTAKAPHATREAQAAGKRGTPPPSRGADASPPASRDVSGTPAGKPGHGAPSSRTSAPAHPGDEPALLREPAAPRPSASGSPPSRPQVFAEEVHATRPEERTVDRAMTEALAADAAEAAAKTAVDELLPGHPGQDRNIERVLATELVAELAESAVRQVLDDGDGTASERDLATFVATQVAEATAGVAVDEVLDRQATAPEERALSTAEDGDAHDLDEDEEEVWTADAWQRNPDSVPVNPPEEALDEDEGEEEVWTADAWQRNPDSVPPNGSQDADDLLEGVERGEQDGVHISVSVIAGAAPTNVEPEVELPDESHDELPPSRRIPLSLVTDEAPPRRDEPGQGASAFAGTEEAAQPQGLAGRAAGMFSLAREIAGQALASEGLGRAVGAMHGLMEAVRTGLGTGGGSRLDDYGKDAGLVENLQPVLDFLYEQYWRVSVEGVDHVPRGAAILVANHSGALPYDGLVMSQVLQRERPDLREARWLVEDQVFHAPMLGTLFNRLGAVRASPENALRLLDEHRPLVVFPEGYQGASKPFAERYRLKRFGRGGFVKLALRTGAPIVPVAIVGAEETSPLLGRLPGGFLGFPSLPLTAPGPLPAKWTIRFGEPLTMEGLPPESADDLGEVQRLTEQTREAIQSMLQALLRERRSVFAG